MLSYCLIKEEYERYKKDRTIEVIYGSKEIYELISIESYISFKEAVKEKKDLKYLKYNYK